MGSIKAEWSALLSEGHCIECRGRLRTLTAAEQIIASDWYATPLGVCERDGAVVGTYPEGDPFICWPPPGEAPLGSSWRTRARR